MIPIPFPGAYQLWIGLMVAGTSSGPAAPGGDAFPTMPDRSRIVAVFDATAGDPAAQGWKENRVGQPKAVTAQSEAGAWWIPDLGNGPDGLTYGLDITPQDQTALQQGWVLEMAVDLQQSDTPRDNRSLLRTTCDVGILHGDGVLHHLTFALTRDGDHGTRPYLWDICGIEHRHQPGDKVQFEMKPGGRGKGHEFTMRIAGVARHFISPAADSPSVPTRIEWGSPPSDGNANFRVICIGICLDLHCILYPQYWWNPLPQQDHWSGGPACIRARSAPWSRHEIDHMEREWAPLRYGQGFPGFCQGRAAGFSPAPGNQGRSRHHRI